MICGATMLSGWTADGHMVDIEGAIELGLDIAGYEVEVHVCNRPAGHDLGDSLHSHREDDERGEMVAGWYDRPVVVGEFEA